jgi:hypothetical protein
MNPWKMHARQPTPAAFPDLPSRHSLEDLGHRLEIGGRHGMELDLTADAKREETLEARQRGVAGCAVNNIAFPKEKTRETSPVLSGHTGNECDFG